MGYRSPSSARVVETLAAAGSICLPTPVAAPAAAAGLAPLLRLSPEDAEAFLDERRRSGTSLAVWTAREQTFLYPPFQFDGLGIRPAVGRLLTA